MPDYIFRPQSAVDPLTSTVIRNGSGQIYDPADESFTNPLTVRDLTGVSLNEIEVGPLGVTPAFKADRPEVIWKSGAYVLVLQSLQGVLQVVQQILENAGVLQGSLPPGGDPGHVLTKRTAAQGDLIWAPAQDDDDVIDTNRLQPVVRWNPGGATGTAAVWETRNPTDRFGVLFLSTNDPAAPPPNDPNLKIGDRWARHTQAGSTGSAEFTDSF